LKRDDQLDDVISAAKAAVAERIVQCYRLAIWNRADVDGDQIDAGR